jgi:hypothetical protein
MSTEGGSNNDSISVISKIIDTEHFDGALGIANFGALKVVLAQNMPLPRRLSMETSDTEKS